jgi:hypothetical protein
MKVSYKIRIYFIALAVALIVAGSGGMCLADQAANNAAGSPAADVASAVNAPAVASDELIADAGGFRIVNGMAILPVLPGNEAAIQSILPALTQSDPDFQGVNMTLFTPVGAKPKILLSGSQSDDRLRHVVEKLKTIIGNMGQPHRLVVAAYLREITLENDDAAGLSWFSNGIQAGLSTGVTTTTTREWDSNGNTPPNLQNPPTITKSTSGYTVGLANPVNVAAALTKAISRGKVIVGSEITIVNGTAAEIKNDDSTPVPLSSDNAITFNTQDISSDVKITPTIVTYNAEKPEESIVRLDVVVQLSVPTATVTFGNGSSALEYTTQTLSSTLYVKADNSRLIGGLFASDAWIKSSSGIPILMNIPILNSLFASKTLSLQHQASILTLSVRILPATKEDGYDY